jgi:glycosyltransferase involved in cell wall biosynthesis
VADYASFSSEAARAQGYEEQIYGSVMMAMLRIYANYKTIDAPWGGANNFLRAMEKYWAADCVEYAKRIDDDYDLLFLNAIGTGPGRADPRKTSLTYGEIRRLKTRGRSSLWRALVQPSTPKKIVLRSVSIEKWSYSRPWLTRRDRHVIAAMNIADHVIFQTAYMMPVFRNAGYTGTRHSVIHNGADPEFFHTRGREYWDGKCKLKVLSCTFSKRPTKRFDLIAALSEMAGVECTHVGNWPSDVASGKVRMAGLAQRPSVGELMRQHHVFMHPAVMDPCPNVVQEALACGLPVLCSRDSGAAELVGPYGITVDDGLADALDQIRDQYQTLTNLTERDHSQFTVARAAIQYLQVFEAVAAGVNMTTDADASVSMQPKQTGR